MVRVGHGRLLLDDRHEVEGAHGAGPPSFDAPFEMEVDLAAFLRPAERRRRARAARKAYFARLASDSTLFRIDFRPDGCRSEGWEGQDANTECLRGRNECYDLVKSNTCATNRTGAQRAGPYHQGAMKTVGMLRPSPRA
jgi:hypothetical protein